MNKCFNDFPRYKNRRYITSYPCRTRSRGAVRPLIERALDICENIVEVFERPTVELILKIFSLTALFIGFFFLVAAIEAGSVSFFRALFSSVGLVAGFAVAMRL